MRLAINALPISRGGGLTVVRGLVQSLREAAPDWEIRVLTSAERTYDAVRQHDAADYVDRILPGAGPARLFLWQNSFLGRWLRRRETDCLISLNYYQHRVFCPQVVYHLNLLRFCSDYRPGNALGRSRFWLRDRAAHLALVRADANVFESNFLLAAAQQVSQSIRNAHVIYIGLPNELLDRPPAKPDAAKQSRRLVAVTSNQPYKDNATLIRTLAELVQREPAAPWALDMVSDASGSWDETHALIERLNVTDRITWHRFAGQEKLTDLLEQALCLVSTSRLESFAMVAIEAMARGCPTIVADCAAMPESVGEAGLLAQPGSATDFADQIQSLAQDPELRQGLIAAGRAWSQKFRWSDCGREFYEVIRGTPE